MAVHSLYFKNAAPSGAATSLSLQDGGTAPTGALTATGWTVAKITSPNLSAMLAGTKRASGTFTTSDAIGSFVASSCWRSENTFTGSFANTNWSLAFRIRASVASAQTGAIKVRLWKSANADGSGATQLTGAVQTGTTTAALSTSASATSTVTWSPGATVTLSNEYLWVQCEWSVVVASGSTTGDAVIYVESAGVITTPDLQPIITSSTKGVLAAQSARLYGSFRATFDPLVKDALITLSNGNLTATSSTTADQQVRSTTSRSTGKFHIELTSTVSAVSNWVAFGLCSASHSIPGAAYLGGDLTSLAFWLRHVEADIVFGGINAVTLGSNFFRTALTNTLAVEVDFDAQIFRAMNATANPSGTTPTYIYDDFSRYPDAATLSGSVPLVGPAWATTGASIPTTSGGKVISSGSGYLYAQLPSAPKTITGYFSMTGGTNPDDASLVIAYAGNTHPLSVNDLLHMTASASSFNLSIRQAGGAFPFLLSRNWSTPFTNDGSQHPISLSAVNTTAVVTGPNGETFAVTDPRISSVIGTEIYYEAQLSTTGGTQGGLHKAIADATFPGTQPTAFNPLDKATTVALSNNNRTATCITAISPTPQVRCSAPRAAGKVHFEITVNAISGADYAVGFGVAALENAQHPLTTYLGGDFKSFGYWLGAGSVRVYAQAVGQVTYTGASMGATAGDVYAVEVDFDNTKAWICNVTKNSGWNNDVIGNQNPATGTGGLNWSAWSGASYFGLTADIEVINSSLTVNSGQGAFAKTPSAGYEPWLVSIAAIGSSGWSSDYSFAGTLTGSPYFVAVDLEDTGANVINFGATPFAVTPTTGFVGWEAAGTIAYGWDAALWDVGKWDDAAAAITAAGTLQAQSSHIVGAAQSSGVSTKGVLTAQVAHITGAASGQSVTTKGVLAAQSAHITGAAVEQSVSTKGALVAQSAHVTGAAQSKGLTTKGILAAQAAHTSGTVVSSSGTTKGILAAQAAHTSGTVVSSSVTTKGVLNAQAAHTTGAVQGKGVTTKGVLAAQAAHVTGSANVLLANAGALVARSAQVAGTALSSAISTRGVLVAQAAHVTGTASVVAASTRGVLNAQAVHLAGSAAVVTLTVSAQGALLARPAAAAGLAQISVTVPVSSGALLAAPSQVFGVAQVSGGVEPIPIMPPGVLNFGVRVYVPRRW